MIKEINGRSLRHSFFSAAKKEEWRRIDGELIPKLSLVDGNKMARILLRRVGDKNPNIRDLVATCLPHLNISNERVRLTAVEAMIKMASSDQEVFPAGRAALYLFHLTESDAETEAKIKHTLEVFGRRVIEMGWEEQLRKNIPDLIGLLS